MKRKLLVIAGLVPVGILAAIGWHRLRCADRFEAFYPTYSMAVADRATERGWIPSRVPSIAVEIHEEHDLDTNEVWIRFQLPASERASVVTSMRQLSRDEVASLHTRNPCRGDWWYEGIIEQEPANDEALNADIYVGKSTAVGGLEFVALDRTGPLIYYWNDPGGSSGITWNGP